jgi:hypothetical protein
MAENEKTSSRIASLASRVAKMKDNEIVILAVENPGAIRSIAGSAWTQAPDRKKFLGIF